VIESTHSNNSIHFYEYLGGKIYHYVEKNDLKWEFYEESKYVLGYTVHKVSTNYGSRSWTGWYCKDIPLNRGPYKFNGLPGALLEITSDGGLFSYKATEIYHLEKQLHIETLNFILEPGKEIFLISKEELNLFRKKYDNLSSSERAYFNRSNKNATYTMMTIDESGEKKTVESRKRRRNYTEKTK
jgi:GLPGLI family protein